MVLPVPASTSYRDDPRYLIETWETEDGLPDNSATAIAQTPDGYLWFGTFQGLVRFNGVEFKVLDSANTPELPSDGIVNLYCDRSGRLWVSTYAGIVVLEGGRWSQVTHEDAWEGDYVRTFTERNNGDLLLTSFSGKIAEFADERMQSLPAPPGEAGQGFFGAADEDGRWWVVQNRFIGRLENGLWVRMMESPELPRDAVGCAVARDGGIWLLLGSELIKWRHGAVATRMNLPERPGGVWSLAEDSQGHVWIATHDRGFCRMTPDGDVTRWNAANGGSESGRSIFEDRERNVWLGTSGDGLARLIPRRFQHFELERGRKGIVVHSVSTDRDGALWAATYGRGLFRLNGTSVTRMTGPGRDAVPAFLQSVLADSGGRLWAGPYHHPLTMLEGGKVRQFPGQATGGQNVFALFEDSRGWIWISGGHAIAKFNGVDLDSYGPGQGVPRASVTSFAEDTSGFIWMTNGEGVFRRTREENFAEVKDASGHSIPRVLCLMADGDGSMWLGSSDRGLLRWKEGRLTALAPRTGLPVTDVRGLVEDDIGFMWITSRRSILRARIRDLRTAAESGREPVIWQTFDAGDGLPKAEFSIGRQPAAVRDERGRLWFATSKGVGMIEPAALRLNDAPPPVHIERISFYRPAASATELATADGEAQEFQEHLSAPFAASLAMPAGSRRLEIHYTGLSFVAPNNVRYQILLGGLDQDWVDAGSSRTASYYELAPGDYVFKVRAANNDGVWNETGATLALSMKPFFWQTWSFLGAMVLLLMALTAFTVWVKARRIHLHKLLEMKRARQQQAELTHASRLSVLGELSASLAHELNQPLTAIMSNAQASQRFMSTGTIDPEEFRGILKDIVDDTTRARDLIRSLRALVSKRGREFGPLDVNDTIQQVVGFLHGDIVGRNVAVSVQLISGLPTVIGDRIQIQQVLVNLLLNAFEAMRENEPPDRRVLILTTLAAPGLVQVTVSDRGTGIPANRMEHLFRAFYTTKTDGLGMGLSVSRTIIESHGGRIWAESHSHRGASFHFTIPVGAKSRGQRPKPAGPDPNLPFATD